MEVAGLAKPVLVGPHTENFAEAVDLLLAGGGALRVGSSADLATAVIGLLRDPARREQMGHAGRETIVARRGATARSAARILDVAQIG
jgi:3-deoxy-D-manno-octulosonic-acid transferase